MVMTNAGGRRKEMRPDEIENECVSNLNFLLMFMLFCLILILFILEYNVEIKLICSNSNLKLVTTSNERRKSSGPD